MRRSRVGDWLRRVAPPRLRRAPGGFDPDTPGRTVGPARDAILRALPRAPVTVELDGQSYDTARRSTRASTRR